MEVPRSLRLAQQSGTLYLITYAIRHYLWIVSAFRRFLKTLILLAINFTATLSDLRVSSQIFEHVNFITRQSRNKILVQEP